MWHRSQLSNTFKVCTSLKSLRHYKIAFCFLLIGGFSTVNGWATSGDGKTSETVVANANNQEQTNTTAAKDLGKDLSGVQVRFSGFVRLLGFYRNMSEYYDQPVQNGLTLPFAIGLNDGTAQPMMMLKAEGNFSPKTYFQIHQSFVNYLGSNASESIIYGQDGKLSSVFADGFFFQGNTHTKYGMFELKAGGGSIYKKLSPMTLWTFQYRDDMFERYPWDPAGSNWLRYESYYNTGDIPRDRRWGRRSIQGIVLDGYSLPLNFDASVIYGKNQNSGGYDNWNTNIPQNMFAGRVAKKIGFHSIGFNWHSQFGYDSDQKIIDTVFVLGNNELKLDSLGKPINEEDYEYLVNTNKTSQLTLTLDGLYEHKHFRFYSEIGMGSYLSRYYFSEDTLRNPSKDKVNNYARPWSPMLYAEVDVKKSLFNFPFKVSGYYLGENAINNSSTILNSSVEEAMTGKDYAQFGAIDQTLYYEGMLTEIGQLTNNRKALDFKTSRNIKNLVVELAFGMQQEIRNIGADTIQRGYHIDRGGVADPSLGAESAGRFNGVNNSVSFYHIVNQFQRGRFHYNRRYQGPYSRLQSDFRRSWENIAITDTVIDYKKSFNMLDLTLKYKMMVADKPLILSAFGRANSVQDAFSVIPVFSDKAFIRQNFYEFMGFYQIHNKWSILAFFSEERALGNKRTELADASGNLITDANGKPVYDETGKPIDQIGRGYGVGFDYDFTERASFDVRYRWYTHEDRNFTKDKFAGQDMTLELKVFF